MSFCELLICLVGFTFVTTTFSWLAILLAVYITTEHDEEEEK